jgi:SNF2 family DNA or RNA helicase
VKLYDYQDEGVHFLMARRRAYLADVPGLGKTAQALIAAKSIGLTPIVVAPAVAVPVWWDEARKWDVPVADVMSYTKLARAWESVNVRELYSHPELIILDEAHYCKSPKAKRTRAALSVARNARRSWLLSGSPMPNDPTELWTVFSALWPERIPAPAREYAGWRDRFTKWSYRPGPGRRMIPKIWGVRNGSELREMCDGIMLRRHVSDVNLQLPPLLGAAKAAPISDILIEERHQAVVVMYHHKDTGAYLRHKLKVGGYVIHGFDGSTPQNVRASEVRSFQLGKYRRAFVVQQQAGGIAITLTAASEIVLVEPDWSPEVNAQAVKRVHRISQDQPVRARIFKVEGSLDEGIMDNLARKIRLGLVLSICAGQQGTTLWRGIQVQNPSRKWQSVAPRFLNEKEAAGVRDRFRLNAYVTEEDIAPPASFRTPVPREASNLALDPRG